MKLTKIIKIFSRKDLFKQKNIHIFIFSIMQSAFNTLVPLTRCKWKRMKTYINFQTLFSWENGKQVTFTLLNVNQFTAHCNSLCFSVNHKSKKNRTPLTNFLSLQRVPDVTVEVVVAGEDEASRVGESQGRDAGVQGAVLIGDHLLVGAQVVHLAGAVVGACDDCVSVWDKLKMRNFFYLILFYLFLVKEWSQIIRKM